MAESKKISKGDDSSKQFIIDLLGGNITHGGDIDCIYLRKGKKWLIIEFLKCDTVDPFNSHPNRYPKNWRKFATLFEIAQQLHGDLWLVNYSLNEEWKNMIKLLVVKGIDYKLVNGVKDIFHYIPYLTTEDQQMDLERFKQLFNEINNEAIGSWES